MINTELLKPQNALTIIAMAVIAVYIVDKFFEGYIK